MPMMAFAVTISDVITNITQIINTLVPLVIAIGVLLFLIGVVNYIRAGDDEEKRKNSRNMMIYGIIGLFVMVSIWGLVALLNNTFGIEKTGITIPPLTPKY